MDLPSHLNSMNDEIKEMKKPGYFSPDEIRTILEKRKDFEKAITKSIKSVQDYKDYIHFENAIFKQATHLEKKNPTSGKSVLMDIMQKRMKCLYDSAYEKFSTDVELSFLYFNFCRQCGFTEAAMAAVQNLIRNNPYNPEVWKMAADFVATDRKDVNCAITVLQKGLHIHRDSQILYSDIVKLHLQMINDYKFSDITDTQEIEKMKVKMCNERLKPYLDMIFENLDNPKYLMELLEILRTASFITGVEWLVIERLQKYITHEIVCLTIVKFYQANKNIALAIQMVNEGLNANPKSQSLYKEAISLQLSLLQEHENAGEEDLAIQQDSCEKLRNYVNSLSIDIYDHDFLISILEILKPHSITKELQQVLIDRLASLSGNENICASLATYLKENNQINKALCVLNRGLDIHKHSQILMIELVQLELFNMYGDGKSKAENDENQIIKEKMFCENVTTRLSVLLEDVDDYTFLINLLDILESHEFTREIQNTIITRLIKSFSDEEMVWHHLAQRERNGLPCVFLNDSQGHSNTFTNCVRAYEEGLKKVPLYKRSNLWLLYLDTLIEIQQDNSGIGNTSRTPTLKAALEQAYEQTCLSERHFMVWLELLDDEQLPEVLEKATTSLPQSVDLWKMRLKRFIIKEDETQVKRVFKLGVLALKENALPLWLMILSFFYMSDNDEIVELIYKDGIQQPREISDALKPRYLEWLALTNEINRVRKCYNLMACSEPYSKELHTVMSRIESAEMEPNYEIWEVPHQLACKQFGESDIDVWLEYVDFYRIYNRGNNMDEKIQQIYKDAQKNLNPLLVADFKDKFEKLLNR